MAHEFVLQGDKVDKLGLANLYSQGLYTSFSYLQDNLQPFILTQALKSQLEHL